MAFVCFFLCAPLSAEPFNLDADSQSLKNIENQLNSEQINYHSLVYLRNLVHTGKNHADACIKEAEHNIQDIQSVLQHEVIKDTSSRYRSLLNLKHLEEQKKADCVYYQFLADKTLVAIAGKIVDVSKNRLFQKQDVFSLPIHDLFVEPVSFIFFSLMLVALIGFLLSVVTKRVFPMAFSRWSNLVKHHLILPAQLYLVYAIWGTFHVRMVLSQQHASSSPYAWLVFVYSIVFIRLYLMMFSDFALKRFLTPKRVVLFMLFCGVSCSWLMWNGYLLLAVILIPNVLATFVLGMIAIEAFYYVRRLFFLLFHDPLGRIANKIHVLLGLPLHQKLIEITILQWVLTVPIVFLFIFSLINMWGASNYQLDLSIKKVQYGMHVLGVSLNGGVFYALAVFCSLSLLGRALGLYLSKKSAFKHDLHRQSVVRLLVTYFAFFIALIVALILMDMDLSKITLIASALSVGLGFGLKDLVGDLISGIILLITKPIKIGDHVMIDGTEGFIKEIGIFSSQIVTLSQSVAIFPNSLVRNQQINNYTFHDKSTRLSIQVWVDKQDDFEMAKELLLAVVSKNKHVIQTPPHQPTVLFDQILSNGALSFMLDLVCFIKDVDRKSHILSELNLDIVRIFKQYHFNIKLSH